ncbi:MAG: hypothetical protein AAGK22_10075, partial [Acidobacteriota bacterium]
MSGKKQGSETRRLGAALWIAVFVASLPAVASAQLARLVADSAEPRFSRTARLEPFLPVEGRLLAPVGVDGNLSFVITDGTPGGTELSLTVQGQQIAGNESLRYFLKGSELVRTDGTRAGTFPVPIPTTATLGSAAVMLGRELLTTYRDDSEFGLLTTTGGGASVTTIPLQDETTEILFRGVGDTLAYFRGSGPSLWVTDGSVGGTRKLHESESFIEGCVVDADRCYFAVSGDPRTLWVSEGTPTTTRQAMVLPSTSRIVAANERGV